MTPKQRRAELLKAYGNSRAFQQKLDKMSDAQIVAFHTRFVSKTKERNHHEIRSQRNQ